MYLIYVPPEVQCLLTSQINTNIQVNARHFRAISAKIFILIHPLLFCQLSSATRTIPYAIFSPLKPFNLSFIVLSFCL